MRFLSRAGISMQLHTLFSFSGKYLQTRTCTHISLDDGQCTHTQRVRFWCNLTYRNALLDRMPCNLPPYTKCLWIENRHSHAEGKAGYSKFISAKKYQGSNAHMRLWPHCLFTMHEWAGSMSATLSSEEAVTDNKRDSKPETSLLLHVSESGDRIVEQNHLPSAGVVWRKLKPLWCGGVSYTTSLSSTNSYFRDKLN